MIADWIDRTNGPLDPIFGVLLCPTAGNYDIIDSVWTTFINVDASYVIFYQRI